MLKSNILGLLGLTRIASCLDLIGAQCSGMTDSGNSADELRNGPRAHLATVKAHSVPIYPSGLLRNGLHYYTLINIMAHCRSSNNIADLVITKKNM